MLTGAASLHWTLLGQLRWVISAGDAVVGEWIGLGVVPDLKSSDPYFTVPFLL